MRTSFTAAAILAALFASTVAAGPAPTREVRGRILDADGAPLAGAVVAEITTVDPNLEDVVRSAEDGTFRLTGVPVEATRLFVHTETHALLAPELPAGETALDLGDLRLSKGATLTGRLRERDGRRILRGAVSLQHPVGLVWGVYCGPDGAFEIPHVGDEPHRLWAVVLSSEGGVAGRRTVEREGVRGGEEALDLVVPTGFAIRLRTPAGEPFLAHEPLQVEVHAADGTVSEESFYVFDEIGGAAEAFSEIRLVLEGDPQRIVLTTLGLKAVVEPVEADENGEGVAEAVFHPDAGPAAPPAFDEPFGPPPPPVEAPLPARPPDLSSPEDVTRFVREILGFSATRDGASSSDPEVQALLWVGPDHVAVLLAELARENRGHAHFHLLQALRKLVEPRHRDVVLAALAGAPGLAEVVVKHGWQEEARETLISSLAAAFADAEGEMEGAAHGWRRARFVHPAVVEAISRLRAPPLDLLVRYFREGANPWSTLSCLVEHAGQDAASLAAGAWPPAASASGSDNRVRQLAGIAVEHGVAAAIPELARLAEESDDVAILRSALRYTGPWSEVRAYVAAGHRRFRFDAARKTYQVEELPPPVTADASGSVRTASGRLVDETGAPAAGAVIGSLAALQAGFRDAEGVGRDDEFTLYRLVTDAARILVVSDAHAFTVIDLPAGAEPADLGDVVLPAGQTLRGRIREADGGEVLRARVALIHPSGYTRIVDCDPHGEFEFPHVGEGMHRLSATVLGSAGGVAGLRRIELHEVEATGELVELGVPTGLRIRLVAEGRGPPFVLRPQSLHPELRLRSETRLIGVDLHRAGVPVESLSIPVDADFIAASPRGVVELRLDADPNLESIELFVSDRKAVLSAGEIRNAEAAVSTAMFRTAGTDLSTSEKYRSIRPPDLASREDVERYVRELLSSIEPVGSWSSTDPEIDLLTRVGADHVSVLLAELKPHRSIFAGLSNDHLIWAVKRLIEERHRDLVIERLPAAPELVEIVVARGWTEAAREKLVETVATALDSPTDETTEKEFEGHTLSIRTQADPWIHPGVLKALADLKSPPVDLLVRTLREAQNPAVTLKLLTERLKLNPAPLLADALRAVPPDAPSHSRSRIRQLAHLGLDHGVPEGLHVLLTYKEEPEDMARLRSALAFPGTDHDLRVHILANHARFRYDPATRTFRLPD